MTWFFIGQMIPVNHALIDDQGQEEHKETRGFLP